MRESIEELGVLLPMAIVALIAMIAGGIFIAIMVARAERRKAEASISNNSFEQLAAGLQKENAQLKAELSEVKETLASINKMMKEIE